MTWQKPGKRRKVKEILRKNKPDIAGSLINQGFPFCVPAVVRLSMFSDLCCRQF